MISRIKYTTNTQSQHSFYSLFFMFIHSYRSAWSNFQVANQLTSYTYNFEETTHHAWNLYQPIISCVNRLLRSYKEKKVLKFTSYICNQLLYSQLLELFYGLQLASQVLSKQSKIAADVRPISIKATKHKIATLYRPCSSNMPLTSWLTLL